MSTSLLGRMVRRMVLLAAIGGMAAGFAAVSPAAARGSTDATHAGRATVAADSTFVPFALCDADGPCLNITDPVAGHEITMFTFSGTDQYEGMTFGQNNPYGCTVVTVSGSGCPFKNLNFDADYAGYPVLSLAWWPLGDCAAPYPGTSITYNTCTADRSVFVVHGETYISPYWTNQDGGVEVLYGPPKGDQAYVAPLTDTTREEWTVRDMPGLV